MNAPSSTPVAFTVNGLPVEYSGPGGRRLLDVLRLDLGLAGTKEGCGEGECGACSVLLDGEVVASCLVPACQADGHAVTTIEGLDGASDASPDPLQTAFLDAGATQCGFCTPGMLVAGRAFLDSGARASDPAIREAIAGNLCRCTGYARIVEAIESAALSSAGRPAGLSQAVPVSARGIPVQVVEAGDGVDVLSARTLDEALRLRNETACRPIAGGTDLLVALAPAGPGQADDVPLLDISSLDELRGIRLEPAAIVVGALTTYAELRRSPLVQEHLPALAQAAASVGAAQIQNRGTIGGNVMNASPAGDMLPILLATDALLVLGSVRGRREVPAALFWPAYRQTLASADELLLEIRIPLPANRRLRFRKVGTRRAQAISKVVLALSWREEAGTWRDVRVALGSVAPVPVRAGLTEDLLEGTRPSAATARDAASSLAAEIEPIDDVRSTAAYRRSVAARILRRMVLDEAE